MHTFQNPSMKRKSRGDMSDDESDDDSRGKKANRIANGDEDDDDDVHDTDEETLNSQRFYAITECMKMAFPEGVLPSDAKTRTMDGLPHVVIDHDSKTSRTILLAFNLDVECGFTSFMSSMSRCSKLLEGFESKRIFVAYDSAYKVDDEIFSNKQRLEQIMRFFQVSGSASFTVKSS